ncbi:MAG: YraN family protein [Candidatus Colwellbacteria bacterium]|nr:YraN family protein [Candidatus Colwellbacteria bacterium]
MEKSSETGKKGEDFAIRYFKKLGYHILAKNHREKWGELDIIVRDPDKTIVFVEVKTINESNSQWVKPEDHFDIKKLDKVRRLSSFYANKNWQLINRDKGWRIDLIALTIDNGNYAVSHYKNV